MRKDGISLRPRKGPGHNIQNGHDGKIREISRLGLSQIFSVAFFRLFDMVKKSTFSLIISVSSLSRNELEAI